MIRLWFSFPAIQKKAECRVPLMYCMIDLIPYLNELLKEEFSGMYEISDDAWFFEEKTGIRISTAVTLTHQNLSDGMCLVVY